MSLPLTAHVPWVPVAWAFRRMRTRSLPPCSARCEGASGAGGVVSDEALSQHLHPGPSFSSLTVVLCGSHGGDHSWRENPLTSFMCLGHDLGTGGLLAAPQTLTLAEILDRPLGLKPYEKVHSLQLSQHSCPLRGLHPAQGPATPAKMQGLHRSAALTRLAVLMHVVLIAPHPLQVLHGQWGQLGNESKQILQHPCP